MQSPSPLNVFVTGTDTNVGKTLVATWLVQLLQASYWKPVQTGIKADGGGDDDARTVAQLLGWSLPTPRIVPSAYRLNDPVSPHEAARRAGVSIDLASILAKRPVATGEPLVVEGAGGLLVPLNRDALMIDLIAALEMPVVLVVRGSLGTLNHTLLSLEALRQRHIPILGLIVNGGYEPQENRQALKLYGQVPILAEIPWVDGLGTDNPDIAKLAAIPPLIPPQRWQPVS